MSIRHYCCVRKLGRIFVAISCVIRYCFWTMYSHAPLFAVNYAIRSLTDRAAECRRSCDLIGFVQLHVPEHWWPALLSWDLPITRDVRFFRFLGELWCNQVFAQVSPSGILEWLFGDSDLCHHMMSESESRVLSEMDDGVEIFRGASERLMRGRCWTLERANAQWYASAMHGDSGRVWRSRLHKTQKTLYFDRAGDRELVLPWSTVSLLEISEDDGDGL